VLSHQATETRFLGVLVVRAVADFGVVIFELIVLYLSFLK